jgi:hypothetical protein
MDLTRLGLWISLCVGGIVIAALSAYSQYSTKKSDEEFRFRPVVRDFCLGAVVSAVLYSFLPESVDELLNSVKVEVKDVQANDIELQTGPARF